jgi:hypothetical protein
MGLRVKTRQKDGQDHRYGIIVETQRVAGHRGGQRQGLHLGEINHSQRTAWGQTIEGLQQGQRCPAQVALFPEDRPAPVLDCEVVPLRLGELQLPRPRPWGACGLALTLWEPGALDGVWAPRLPPSRPGTRGLNGLKARVCSWLIDPGREGRWHRRGLGRRALADRLGEDVRWVQADTLARCLDKLLPPKTQLFSDLKERWQALFDACFEGCL